jgi:hypothetical protein
MVCPGSYLLVPFALGMAIERKFAIVSVKQVYQVIQFRQGYFRYFFMQSLPVTISLFALGAKISKVGCFFPA